MDKCGGGRRVVRTHNPPRHLKSSNPKQKGNCLLKTQLLGNRNKPINPNLQNHWQLNSQNYRNPTTQNRMVLNDIEKKKPYPIIINFASLSLSHNFASISSIPQPKLIGHSMWRRRSYILETLNFNSDDDAWLGTFGIVEGTKKTGEWFASSSYMLFFPWPKISPLSAHWKLQQHRMVRISNFSRGGMCEG